MGFEVIVLLTVLMRIHSAVCCFEPTCSFSASCSQADEMTSWLEKAMNLTRNITRSLKAISLVKESEAILTEITKEALQYVLQDWQKRLQSCVRLNDDQKTTCNFFPEDCKEIYLNGFTSSGVYAIWPRSRIFKTKKSVQVFCDMETDGGGWTVIQRRGNFGRPSSYFYKDWENYKKGFGNITQDFWIGNDLLFALTSLKLCSLRFDLRDLNGESRWAMYDTFWVESEACNYTLNVQGYRGNAGDSFGFHNGNQFTIWDRDNDLYRPANCAQLYKGAWWYSYCFYSNLNGLYLNGPHKSLADGINWRTWHGYLYSLPFTEMKIRPSFVSP